MTDQYHWRRLRSSVLPVEPEAIAVCGIWDLISRRLLDIPLSKIIHDAGISPRENIPVEIASDLIMFGSDFEED